jgi:hypothetical protein
MRSYVCVPEQRERLAVLLEQIERAADAGKLVLGMNLDANNWREKGHWLLHLMEDVDAALTQSNLWRHTVGNTYCAFRKSKSGNFIESAIGHVYTSEREEVRIVVIDN